MLDAPTMFLTSLVTRRFPILAFLPKISRMDKKKFRWNNQVGQVFLLFEAATKIQVIFSAAFSKT